MKVDSKLITLQEIVGKNWFFTVPIYQRLYVWEEVQVRTLLEDLWTAHEGSKKFFYLGGTLVKESTDEYGRQSFELIDGQQRFTTLWMISMIQSRVSLNDQIHWSNALEPFQRAEGDDRFRVSFPIRPEVEQFFKGRLAGKEVELAENPRIIDALGTIQSFFDDKERKSARAAFTLFIHTKVQMVLTTVPPTTDLNKLFEVINSRGVQLQHHEILKARLLSKLTDSSAQRDRYAYLWDACAEMGNFVEKNLKDLAKVRVGELFAKKTTNGLEALASAHEVLAAIEAVHQSSIEATPVSLEEILRLELDSSDASSEVSDDESYGADKVRSIISFPMLLQHTLRIWLCRQGENDLSRILDKELLSLFESRFPSAQLESAEVKSFIELLWEVRYCFDKHVIKWVSDGDTEWHAISRLRLDSSKTSPRLVRERTDTGESQGFALLQSMLYHSQQITTHYWLTPLLSFLQASSEELHASYAFLRHLDTHLLCSAELRSLSERSRSFVENPWTESKLVDAAELLAKADGVHFAHYWFYKLEFILWEMSGVKMTDEQRGRFRMTAKNSVEHISPQKAQGIDSNVVSEHVLDTFGNLALVSRGINSEYGNKPYTEKRAHFLERNKERLDSLKMALIYQHATWNDDLAKAHQERMISLITDYLNRNHRK